MKLIFSFYIIGVFILFSCSSKTGNNGNNPANEVNFLQRQEEMVKILERNENNPTGAINELDAFYKKYAHAIKKDYQRAFNRSRMSNNEYQREPSARELELTERIRNATSKLTKKDRYFYRKNYFLRKKYGITGNQLRR